MWKRMLIQTITAGMSLIMFGSIVCAQSPVVSSGDDPVKRAMESVWALVDARAAAADRVIEASKLVRESAEARKLGKLDQAIEALERAERIAAEGGQAERSSMTVELLRRVAGERAALDLFVAPPSDGGRSAVEPIPLEGVATNKPAIPRSVLARYGMYRETLTRILREENLPPELLAVALVESGLNPLALSPKGARGIWQFMPSTAERYGLRARPDEDHRTSPEHSTRAAARYLRDLYRMFGDWKLALAAYNAGETKVRQVIDRTGIRDFDELARLGLLPLETRKYVPATLAVWSQLSDGRAASR